jgi:hypothetical protein
MRCLERKCEGWSFTVLSLKMGCPLRWDGVLFAEESLNF